MKPGDHITFGADGVPRMVRPRIVATVDSTKTFDAVLGNYVLVTWEGKDNSARVLKEYPADTKW